VTVLRETRHDIRRVAAAASSSSALDYRSNRQLQMGHVYAN